MKQRLDAIDKLETELVEKAQAILPKGAINIVDFFILGATQRTLSQSTAFRTLIEEHVTFRRQQFSCATRSISPCG